VNQWAEWDIFPTCDHDVFLKNVIAEFTGNHDLASWHFFWEWGEHDNKDEEVLRIRILGTRLIHQEFRNHLESHEAVINGGEIQEWYEGAHGVRGEVYKGEESFYGKKVWEKTYRLWHAHAELALLLAVQSVTDELERPRSMHWRRTAHLTCNQFELPDIRMCLEQAQRYMYLYPQLTDGEVSPADSRLQAELDKYLYPSTHI
jgi:hypothetical protein